MVWVTITSPVLMFLVWVTDDQLASLLGRSVAGDACALPVKIDPRGKRQRTLESVLKSRVEEVVDG